MKVKGKKFLSLFLVFSLGALSGNLMAKERQGAKLVVKKKAGQQIEGELITVKQSSLLLLNTDGKDESINIADINVIKIVKKSKAYELGLGGFLIGGVTRGVLHSAVRKEKEGEEATQHFVQASVVAGAIGLAAGIIIGTVLGIDKTIRIEGKSDSEIKKILEKLRKKARIPNYQ